MRLWLLLVFAAGSAAQSIPDSEVARARHLLDSAEWRDKAWGAYFAGRLHSDKLTDRLLDAFREAAALRDARPVTEAYGYVAALFDAAIESGMAVPPELLQPFEENWREPAIILLARGGASEETLLRLRTRKLSDAEWLAVNNLMLQHRSPVLFALVLREVSISHLFVLTDPNDGGGYGGGTGGGSCGDGFAAMPPGFPPVGLYILKADGEQGDVLVARGPENAYYHRFEIPTDRQSGFGACAGSSREWVRIGYLAELAAVPRQQAEGIFHAVTTIRFQNELKLRQEWNASLAAQENAIRAFARTAQQKGMVTGAAITLRVISQVDDHRKAATGAIPPVTPHEFVLE